MKIKRRCDSSLRKWNELKINDYITNTNKTLNDFKTSNPKNLRRIKTIYIHIFIK